MLIPQSLVAAAFIRVLIDDLPGTFLSLTLFPPYPAAPEGLFPGIGPA